MKHPVVMPHLGATGGDVKIISWRIEESDFVAAGAALVEVETDKSVVEVEAFRDGRLVGPLAAAGSAIAPGEVIGYLSDDPAGVTLGAAASPAPQRHEPEQPAAEKADMPTVPTPANDRPSSATHQLRPARIVVKTSRSTGGTSGAAFAERLVEAFGTMALIRRYEEHLYRLFLQGLVPGTLHQCQGQEAVAVGVCSALQRDDLVYSTHRPVGHLIAKGASLKAITAEIWGKATGCVGGKGGQMHLADFSVGAMVSNAIVGANIPIATGSAMSFRLQGIDRVAVSFFGDGASNIGAFHEGLNLAAVQDAPVIFVCENNLYAASTHFGSTARITDIADRAAGYGMPGVVVDGMDVEAVFAATRTAVARARAGGGPTLIEAKTYRYRGHSRGDPGGYRGRDEHEAWTERDPIERLRRRLTDDFAIPAARLSALETAAQAQVEEAVEFAQKSPEPPPGSGLEHVFA
ncbi:thiamine pyrophosphate-dependent enzyme [Bradyrhizobium tunisiense]|uniref:thiamine pyrophosphate-dependent enzyme n=1 Tax=Bradyrhizobium tunisiense TaxID=3278709 RepID=UPI0035E1C018